MEEIQKEVVREVEEKEVKPVESNIEEAVSDKSNESISILDKVNKFMESSKPSNEENPEEGPTNISLADIEKIEDPVARQVALDKFKLLERGYNQKFQELAELRKALESNQTKAEEAWTVDRVQKLLQDPQFVNVAQQISGYQPEGQDDDEYSALSPREQALMQKLEAQTNMIQKQMSEAERFKQDSELKSKYKDYNPQAVDTLTADLLAGRVQATREHLHKVATYDTMKAEMLKRVEAAYELGRSERDNGIPEKVQATSFQGQTTTPTSTIQKKEGETSKQFFKRIADNVVQNMKG